MGALPLVETRDVGNHLTGTRRAESQQRQHMKMILQILDCEHRDLTFVEGMSLSSLQSRKSCRPGKLDPLFSALGSDRNQEPQWRHGVHATENCGLIDFDQVAPAESVRTVDFVIFAYGGSEKRCAVILNCCTRGTYRFRSFVTRVLPAAYLTHSEMKPCLRKSSRMGTGSIPPMAW